MQWNCPHCGVKLSLSDESVHSGWSFSKCFKCAGFALIRKAEINVIKVDKAPPGENVLLPDASSAVLHASGNHSSVHTAHITPSNFGPGSGGGGLGLISENATRNLMRHVPPPAPMAARRTTDARKLPDPLPEIPTKPQIIPSARRMPLGIVVATIASVVSGFYFYSQAQALWQRAQNHAAAARVPAVITDQIQDTATAPLKNWDN